MRVSDYAVGMKWMYMPVLLVYVASFAVVLEAGTCPARSGAAFIPCCCDRAAVPDPMPTCCAEDAEPQSADSCSCGISASADATMRFETVPPMVSREKVPTVQWPQCLLGGVILYLDPDPDPDMRYGWRHSLRQTPVPGSALPAFIVNCAILR